MPSKADYWKDPEKYRAATNQYRLDNPEWHRESNRNWVALKREDPAFIAKEKEQERKYRLAATAERKAARAAYMKEWHAAHPNYARDVQAIDHRKYPARRMVEAAKHRAKRLGLPFSLNWWEITIPETCPVLGIPLIFGDKGFQENSPSLDRVIPELGYTKENVRVISYRANALKNDATLAEMEALVAYLKREMSG